MTATLVPDVPIAVQNVEEIPRDKLSWQGRFASGLRSSLGGNFAGTSDRPRRRICQRSAAGHRSGLVKVNFT
jgi:hypothetical protein